LKNLIVSCNIRNSQLENTKRWDETKGYRLRIGKNQAEGSEGSITRNWFLIGVNFGLLKIGMSWRMRTMK
jgi:hypothetical protein